MREFHRWFGLVSGLFMIVVALTGLALQLDLWLTGTEPPHAPPAPPPARTGPPPSGTTIQHVFEAALARVHADRPLYTFSDVKISFAGEQPSVTFSGGSEGGIQFVSGALSELPPPPTPAGFHGILQDIHAGYFAGFTGRIISCALAIALLVLGVSGLVLYADMFGRRRNLGKKNPFWR